MAALWLKNKHLKVDLCEETKGGLKALVDGQTGRNFIFSTPYPLYRITLARPGEDPITCTSADAESFEVRRADSPEGEALELVYGRHRSLDVRITCRVLLEADSGLSRWRISVANGTAYGVRAIDYPVVVAPSVLGESDEDDYFLGSGWLNHRPGRGGRKRRAQSEGAADGAPREQSAQYNWRPHHYPGPISVQMQAYYDSTAGLYMATHDDHGCVKHFGCRRATDDDALDLSITHHYDERPGLAFELPYDTVLGIFHGDWYAAADLYKEWAHKQHWCAKKLTERTDIPAWATEPRPNLMIISRGNVERARGTLNSPPAEWPIGRYWPAQKAVSLIRKYTEILQTPAVVWYEGWEKIGSPGGPVDVFPPYEGEDSFKAAMAEFRRDGNVPLLYITGFHWCYKRSMTGYDGRECFEREGMRSAVRDEQGQVVRCIFMNAQKEFVNLCVAGAGIKKLLLENLLRLIDLGGIAVQIDQQLGMYACPCYSDQHDHPPGYGPWMHDHMREFLRHIRSAIKQRSTEIAFSYETACEAWIQETDLHLDRAYRIGAVPLFAYIYHEYALMFGGDDRMGLSHPEVSMMKHALICTQGVQNVVSIGEPEYDLEVEEIDHPVIPLLKNIFRAQRTYARDYLVFGRMLRPTELQAVTVPVDKYLSCGADPGVMGTVEVPTVFPSVWRSPAGKIGYVLVNWTGSPQTVTLTLVNTGGGGSIVTSGETLPIPEDEWRSGKVTTIIPGRSVVLIEHEGSMR